MYYVSFRADSLSLSLPLSLNHLSAVLPSTLPMRLVSPNPITEPYIGRLQVQHNGIWGHVCDDLFGLDDANVACWSLNYTAGAICYANRPFPPSSGVGNLHIIYVSVAESFLLDVMRL